MGQIKNLTIILVILLSSMAYIGIAFAETKPDSIIIEIQIAPATLNLNLDRPSVTVHTNISYYKDADCDIFRLEDIPASDIFEDSCGNLVARFNRENVTKIVDLEIDVPYEATLVLTGETLDGDSFTGSDTIRVIDPPNN